MSIHGNVRDGAQLNSGSFADHGVPDARVLYRAVEQALDTPPGTSVRVDPMPLGVVAAAYRDAFRSATGAGRGSTVPVPPDVEAALTDAVALTDEQYHNHVVAIREDLLPTFYAHFVGFHGAYHGGSHPVIV